MEIHDKLRKVTVFDFDGTLTSADTLLCFIRYAKGMPRLLLGLALFAPLLVCMKLRLADNGKTKERLFAFFFKGTAANEFDTQCDKFGNECRHLLRDGGRDAVAAAVENGDRVFIISASVSNWVIPFFYGGNSEYAAATTRLIEVVGTEVEVRDGRLTGRFLTPNCYGAEKVRRLAEALPDVKVNRDRYHVTAYGDSRGDRQMLDFADEGHFRPFR